MRKYTAETTVAQSLAVMGRRRGKWGSWEFFFLFLKIEKTWTCLDVIGKEAVKAVHS